jgi:hypothetical protein
MWFVNDKLNNEFLGFFPFGNDSLLGVSIHVHHFKITPPNIVYCPLSNIHKDGIKKIITQYNKFDTKVPIFVIPEDSHNANHITPRKLRKWEDIQDIQFLIIGGQHTILAMKVCRLHLIPCISCFMVCNENSKILTWKRNLIFGFNKSI